MPKMFQLEIYADEKERVVVIRQECGDDDMVIYIDPTQVPIVCDLLRSESECLKGDK